MKLQSPQNNYCSFATQQLSLTDHPVIISTVVINQLEQMTIGTSYHCAIIVDFLYKKKKNDRRKQRGILSWNKITKSTESSEIHLIKELSQLSAPTPVHTYWESEKAPNEINFWVNLVRVMLPVICLFTFFKSK